MAAAVLIAVAVVVRICTQVVKNDERTHNLIVCTLCSCYPAAVLGLSPDWYKSAHYRCSPQSMAIIHHHPLTTHRSTSAFRRRSMAVRAPRQLLQQLGLQLPPATRVLVHDSTAEMRYMVLPMRPEVPPLFPI